MRSRRSCARSKHERRTIHRRRALFPLRLLPRDVHVAERGYDADHRRDGLGARGGRVSTCATYAADISAKCGLTRGRPEPRAWIPLPGATDIFVARCDDWRRW